MPISIIDILWCTLILNVFALSLLKRLFIQSNLSLTKSETNTCQQNWVWFIKKQKRKKKKKKKTNKKHEHKKKQTI